MMRVSMFRSALMALLIVGASGRSLMAQDTAPVGGLPECTVPGAESLRLYMPDGQLISHGLTLYMTTISRQARNLS